MRPGFCPLYLRAGAAPSGLATGPCMWNPEKTKPSHSSPNKRTKGVHHDRIPNDTGRLTFVVRVALVSARGLPRGLVTALGGLLRERLEFMGPAADLVELNAVLVAVGVYVLAS